MSPTSPAAAPDSVRLAHRAADEHADLVYRVAYRVVRNASDAEDIVQDVFLKLLRLSEGSARTPEGDQLRPWLTRVTLHRALNYIRSETGRRRREERWQRERPGRSDAMSSRPSSEAARYPTESSTAEPGGELERQETIDHLDRAVQELPDTLRVPLVLHFHEGFRYREIASTLACPEGTVAKRIHTAKERLRQSLRWSPAVVAAQLADSAEPIECPPEVIERLHARIDREAPSVTSATTTTTVATTRVALRWLAIGVVLIALGTVAVKTVPGIGGDATVDRERETASRTENEEDASGLLASTAEETDARTSASDAEGSATSSPTGAMDAGSAKESPLWGRVTDAEEGAIEGARVEIVEAGEVLAEVATDAEGYYRFASLPDRLKETPGEAPEDAPEGTRVRRRMGGPPPAGGFAVGGAGDGGASIVRRSQIELRTTRDGFLGDHWGVPRPLPESLRHDVELLPSALLEGVVLAPDATPIAGATVAFVGGVSGFRAPPQPPVVTDGEGRFRFLRLEAGAYVFSVRADGYAPEPFVAVAGGDEVSLTLRAGAPVEFRLVDRAGGELPDLDVRVEQPGRPISFAVSDRDGIAYFPHLVAGSATVRVYSRAFEVHERTFTIAASGGEARSIVETVSLGRTLRGRVIVDAGTKPDANLEAVLSTRTTPAKQQRTAVGDDGTFAFDGVPAGPYWLDVYVTAGHWQRDLRERRALDIDADAPGDAPLLVDFRDTPRTRLTIDAQDEEGKALDFCFVEIESANGWKTTRPVSATAREFLLPYGEYSLRVSAWAHAASTHEVTLDDEEHDLSVELAATDVPSPGTTTPNRLPADAEPRELLPGEGAGEGSAPAFAFFRQPVPLAVYLDWVGAWLEQISEHELVVDGAVPDDALDASIAAPTGPVWGQLRSVLRGKGLALEVEGRRVWVVTAN